MIVQRVGDTYVITIDERGVVEAIDATDPTLSEIRTVVEDYQRRGRAIADKRRNDQYAQLPAAERAAVDEILARARAAAAEVTTRTRRV